MRDFEARRMKLAGGSPTVALNAKGIRMKEEGIDVLSFAAGEPDFDTPEAVKAAAIEAIRHNDTHYTSAAGTLALRRRIVKKLREENGIDAQEDGILVTPGAKLALYAAMTCFLEEGYCQSCGRGSRQRCRFRRKRRYRRRRYCSCQS